MKFAERQKLLSAGLSAKSVTSVYALRNIELRVATNPFIFHASGEMKSNDNYALIMPILSVETLLGHLKDSLYFKTLKF